VVGSQVESQSSADFRVQTDRPPVNRSGALPPQRVTFIIKDSRDDLMSMETVLLACQIASLSACVGVLLFWKKCRSQKSVVRKAESDLWTFGRLAQKPSLCLYKGSSAELVSRR
jgi:hypothetical protein